VEKNARAEFGRWRLGQLWPVALVVALTAIDTAVALTSPAFAHAAAPLAVVIAWLDVVVVAYFFGMWPGVLAAVVTAGFDAAVLQGNRGGAGSNAAAVFLILPVQIIVAAAIGRLRVLARRVREQDGALQYRDRRFRALTEDAGDLIVVIDAHGRPTFASASHLAVLGYQPDDIVAGRLGGVFDDSSQRRIGALVGPVLVSILAVSLGDPGVTGMFIGLLLVTAAAVGLFREEPRGRSLEELSPAA